MSNSCWSPYEHSRFLLGIEKCKFDSYNLNSCNSLSLSNFIGKHPQHVQEHLQEYISLLREAAKERELLNPWSIEENKKFEVIIAKYIEYKQIPNNISIFDTLPWNEIGKYFPNRTISDLKYHFQQLSFDIMQITFGSIDIPNYLPIKKNSSPDNSQRTFGKDITDSSIGKRQQSCPVLPQYKPNIPNPSLISQKCNTLNNLYDNSNNHSFKRQLNKENPNYINNTKSNISAKEFRDLLIDNRRKQVIKTTSSTSNLPNYSHSSNIQKSELKKQYSAPINALNDIDMWNLQNDGTFKRNLKRTH